MLMLAVNWDGTEKVIDTGAVWWCHTKLYVVWEKNAQSPKKVECLYFQKFQPFIPKYPLKHQYLREKSHQTISSIHYLCPIYPQSIQYPRLALYRNLLDTNS